MSGFWAEAAILDFYYQDTSKMATVDQIAEIIQVHPCAVYAALEKLCDRSILHAVTGSDGLFYYSYYVPFQSKMKADSELI
ncbi:hypothetical protein [Paenibacillus pinistramenti]|uniref:hypothetical protein n=1 Tax=Paenibacillus pinistramenti TaxID=1768003 RepID=UPI001107F20A|nr:hypothetical protein [Paenibacillus pinistramenti]